MRGFFIVKLAMDGNSDPKESDLELELEPCRWILEHNMEIQNMYRKCIIIHMYFKIKILIFACHKKTYTTTNIETDLLTPTIMVFSEDLSTYYKTYIKSMVINYYDYFLIILLIKCNYNYYFEIQFHIYTHF